MNKSKTPLFGCLSVEDEDNLNPFKPNLGGSETSALSDKYFLHNKAASS